MGQNRSLGAAIKKACAAADKAWGHANFVQGVGNVANQIVGYGPNVNADEESISDIMGYEQDARAREG